jgi:PAS domain S-box-containing protein
LYLQERIYCCTSKAENELKKITVFDPAQRGAAKGSTMKMTHAPPVRVAPIPEIAQDIAEALLQAMPPASHRTDDNGTASPKSRARVGPLMERAPNGLIADRTIWQPEQGPSVRAQRSNRAQHYLDMAEVMVLALDIAGTVTLVNRYACAVLERPAVELLGYDWIETCLPVRIRGRLGRKFQDVLRGDRRHVTNLIVTKSGDERSIAWHNALLRNREGQIVGTLSSGVDITKV